MPLPPEGNALSAELRGSIPDANTAQRPIQAPGTMRHGLLFLVLALCACQSLAPPDSGATLRARERDILDEATAIARAAAADLQRAEATVVYEATKIASMQQENTALLVTVRAGDASPARRQGTGIIQRPPLTPGSRWFEKTGVSRFIKRRWLCRLATDQLHQRHIPAVCDSACLECHRRPAPERAVVARGRSCTQRGLYAGARLE